MKTLTLISATALLLLSMQLFAVSPDSAILSINKKLIVENLTNNLIYPTQAKTELIEGCVSALIKFEKDGKPNVIAINGHPMLTKSLKKQIESKRLYNLMPYPSNEICVRINFKIE